MAGAGETAERYVLLHWPRGSWRVPRVMSHGMPEVLSRAILAANAAGIHVALVDGDDIALSFKDRVVHAANSQQAAEYLTAITAGQALEGEVDERMTILCCTDGKQDPCCARYGFATWKALRAEADPARFRVLQATHLGGCRFAASLIVLPSRQRYGRLEPRQVSDFLACLSDGLPFLPAYRGNPHLDAASQVAEHAAMTFARNLGLKIETKVSLSRLPVTAWADELDFLARIDGLRLRVRLTPSQFEVNTRCKTLADGPSETVRRWLVETIEQVG